MEFHTIKKVKPIIDTNRKHHTYFQCEEKITCIAGRKDNLRSSILRKDNHKTTIKILVNRISKGLYGNTESQLGNYESQLGNYESQ